MALKALMEPFLSMVAAPYLEDGISVRQVNGNVRNGIWVSYTGGGQHEATLVGIQMLVIMAIPNCRVVVA